jgi:DNA-binding transcriptional LysR family regulator
MFDLNLLRVLAAVIEEGTVTAAAEKLQLSQPAISQSITRLQKVVKEDLFIKAGRRIMPTRVANQLYQDTAELLHQADAAINSVITFDPSSTKSTFRIALTDIGQHVFLPDLTQVLRVRAPQARLKVTSLNTANVADQLETGELDVAIMSTKLDGQIRSEVLHHGNYLCIARRGLFHSPGPSLKDLKSHPRVAVTTSTGHTLMEKYLEPDPPGSIIVGTFGAIPTLVASTDLIAFVPEVLVQTWETDAGLDVWEIKEVETTTEVRACFSSSPKSRASSWFIVLVIENLRQSTR